MHALIMVLLFAQIQGGVITGRIVSVDGTPAAQQRVAAEAVLERSDVALGASMMAGLSQTDNDGRFRLENVPPGRYYIVLFPLDTPSYYPGVNKKESATIVSVADGALIGSVDFKVPDFAGGKVFGGLAAPPWPLTGAIQVTMVRYDSSLAIGSPIPNPFTLTSLLSNSVTVSVSALGILTLGPSSGNGSSRTISATVSADGTFEFPKARAGKYALSTNPNIGLSTTTVEIVDVDVHDVELIAGTSTGIVQGVTVRGHVGQNPIPELLNQLTVVMAVRGSVTGAPRAPVHPDGSFAFTNVQPGSYIAITIPSPNVSMQTALTVGNQNIDDVVVVPPDAVDVPGRFEIEGSGQLKALSSPMTIEVYHAPLASPVTTIEPASSFKVHVLDGENWIKLRNVPADYFVSSITYGGSDLLHLPLVPLRDNTEGVRIVLAPEPASALHKVSGQVDGLPSFAIGPDAKIVLYGEGIGQRFAETTLKPEGTFEFPRVPSGSFTAVVVNAPFESARTFDVGTKDVVGLRMKGEIWKDISGRVTIVDRNGTILPGFPFSYMAVEFSPSVVPFIAMVQMDGTFTQTLSGGEYNLAPNKLPEGYTVKSITAGETDLLKGKLKIDGRPVPEVLVTLEYRPKSNP